MNYSFKGLTVPCALAPAKLFGSDREIKQAVNAWTAKMKEAKRLAVQAEQVRVSKARQAWREAQYLARGGSYYEKPNPNWSADKPHVHPAFTLPTDSALVEQCRVESMAIQF